MQPAPIGLETLVSAANAASAPIGADDPNYTAGQSWTAVSAASAAEAVGEASQPTVAERLTTEPLTEQEARSACAPWRAAILSKLDQGLTSQRIYQDLAVEHGYCGSYYSVVRFVRRLGKSRTLPFRRMECGPAEEAQVDFGTGAPFLSLEGRRRRPHVFRIILSYSRKGYTEAVARQTISPGDSVCNGTLVAAFTVLFLVPLIPNSALLVSINEITEPSLNCLC